MTDPKTERLRHRLAWVLIGTVVALLAASVTSILVSQAANRKSQRSIDCVSRVLASRSIPTSRDALAHVAFAQSLLSVLTAPKAQQPTAFRKFVGDVTTYVNTLTADEAFRDTHPLGAC